MEDKHPAYDVENERHVTDTIVDLYSRNYSRESIASANENDDGISTEGMTTPLIAQRSISSSSLSVSPPALSTMPLENIGFEPPATIVAQERNNIQALKRISLDASSTSDPDLPAASIALLQHRPTSPPATSPSSASSAGIQQGFSFDDGPSYQTDGALLWVPAHLHPELAPKEWRTFVQERVAEIQHRTGANATPSQVETGTTASGLLSVPPPPGGTGPGIVRRKSKLSREIYISDDSVTGYEDGADVLQERAKAKSPEVRVSDLEWLETYARQTRSTSGSPNLPGGIVISERNVITPLNKGRGLRRSQHTSRKTKRLVESERRLSMTSEETLPEGEKDEKYAEMNMERVPTLTSSPPLFAVPDCGPQVTVTDGKLQLNINETDLGSLDIDADIVIEAAKSVDTSDVAVAPDKRYHSSSCGTSPGHVSSSSTSSSSTVSTVSSASTAKASIFPECSADGVSLGSGRSEPHRSTSRSGTPTPKISSSHRQSPISRFTSKRLITDILSRSSSSTNVTPESDDSPGTASKTVASASKRTNTVVSMPSMAATGDPNSRTDELSVIHVLDSMTSVHQAQSPQPGPSLKKRGKALTAGFGRLFTSDKEKEKEKEKARSLTRKDSGFKVNLSPPSRSDSISDLGKEARVRETLDLERSATPIADIEKVSLRNEKESKLSNFFGAKKKALTKSNGLHSSSGRRDKKGGNKSKHVRTSGSSSSLSSSYTDPYVGKSQSPSTPPSPSRAQIAKGNSGRPYYYSRFPLHVERAIYRLSHLKLANPRRPLCQQVLLSNFMYSYLELINQDSMYGYQQQQQYLQAYPYNYQQQQYVYQQQLQQQVLMQNLQLQMHHQQQSQNILHQQQQQQQHLPASYSDEENMFAGMESPASDRQINRSVHMPAVTVQGGSISDDVDTYWQDSDSDDDVYGTYFDATEDDVRIFHLICFPITNVIAVFRCACL
ncbi:hypothetical protein V1520DRAFT_367437 [Lipomyces starkeyi]|uniref:Protein Zds1 C-terminal domain-containing protein n=1 Tax=Lipomyces starkeyi NRRL Y-11557 TaxID=675824 RepID=A0A1E3QFG0_LIPST|nr:hypothetical protein LIPSTDRAFT_215163 [Lipomyces starkeyi NRRL Y-11557]